MAIDKALLDQLLAGRDPQELFARGGLIDELKKALSERMLAAELEDHLETEAEAGLGLSVILCAGSVSIIRPRTYRRIGWRIGFWPRTTRAAVASMLRPLD
jgi:hypothetical protein